MIFCDPQIGNAPKGAIIDTWTGQGFQELSFMNKIKFKHQEGNFKINHTMQDWVEKYGDQYVID